MSNLELSEDVVVNFLKEVEKIGGCRDHDDCLTCPYPLCKYDGYNPRRTEKSVTHHGAWSTADENKLKRLLTLDVSYSTLANVFRRDISDVEEKVKSLGVLE